MEITWVTFLIVCPMVFLAGFVDSIAGGGGLISLPAYMLSGLPAHAAVATNKLSSSVGTFASTIRYIRNKCVDFRLAVPSVIMAVIGAQIGSRLALLVADEVFKILLLVALPGIAVWMLTHKNLDPPEDARVDRKKQMIYVTVASLVIGLYDGFYGPGTGTFLTLVYTGFCKMKVLKAAGNVKLANLASNLSALLVFLTGGHVVIALGLTASVFSIAGNWLGSGVAIRNGSRLVRWVIVAVLALLFVKVITDLLVPAA